MATASANNIESHCTSNKLALKAEKSQGKYPKHSSWVVHIN